MTKNKNEFDKNNDEFNKKDFIIANTFVIVLAISLAVACIVMLKMT